MSERRSIMFFVTPIQMGFLLSLAQVLSSSFDIIFVARDIFIKRYLKQRLSGINGTVIDFSEYRQSIGISESNNNRGLEMEEKYDERLSCLTSYNRGLGKGYIFNVDKHPIQKMSLWSMEKKYRFILKDLASYESLIEKYRPTCIFSSGLTKTLFMVARKRGILCLMLGMVKYGRRCFWVENEYYQNHKFIEFVQKEMKEGDRDSHSCGLHYRQEAISQMQFENLRRSFCSMMKTLFKKSLTETYQRIKRLHNRDGYVYLGWTGAIWNSYFIYRYFQHYGKRPVDLKHYRIVFFPLHLEPEVALLSVSPEFNNSMEMIAWISKSLPADTVLVVKEAPQGFGVRSRRYYNNFRRMANVHLAHPDTSSWEWIKASELTATITGTAAIESVYFDRPVLSFGKHQIVNHLPTSRYAFNYETTKKYVEELLDLDPRMKTFGDAKAALYQGQMHVSFELPDYDEAFFGRNLQRKNADVALKKLIDDYKDVFGVFERAGGMNCSTQYQGQR